MGASTLLWIGLAVFLLVAFGFLTWADVFGTGATFLERLGSMFT